MNMKLKMHSNISMEISTEIMLCRDRILKIFESVYCMDSRSVAGPASVAAPTKCGRFFSMALEFAYRRLLR